MEEADGCFAGLFLLIWGWEPAVTARRNHLGIHGNKVTTGLAVFVGCGTRLVSLHIFHPKGLSALSKIPRQALTQSKGLCSPGSAQGLQQRHVFHFSRADNVV